MSDTERQKKARATMRLAPALHERVAVLTDLTNKSQNDVISDAVEFLCALAEGQDGAEIPLPEIVVMARAIRAHRNQPTEIIRLSERYTPPRPGDGSSRVAETSPLPKEASARRASGR